MARYIDAEKLKPDAVVFLSGYDEKPSAVYSHERIDNAPPVDAVPVVRCKDCKFYGNCGIEEFGCMEPYDYCSRGKRKEPENAGYL